MFEITGNAVVWRGNGETLRVEPWGANSLRVRARVMGEILDTDYALLPPAASETQIELDGAVAVVRNGKIQAVLHAISEHDAAAVAFDRSEERRVGKEGGHRRW